MNWQKNRSLLRNSIEKNSYSKIFVHSDSFRAMNFVELSSKPSFDMIMTSHCEFINSLCEFIYLPCFNYDFPKSRLYNYDIMECNVGALPVLYAEKYDVNRTFDPMFSMVQSHEEHDFVTPKSSVDPFSKNGVFERFNHEGAAILFYGCDISSLTFIHYLETVMNSPYRYYKSFEGESIHKGVRLPLTFHSHFRPLNKYFEYDWRRIQNDLIGAGILVKICENTYILDALGFYEFSINVLSSEPLYYLDDDTRSWVEPMLERLGRPFQMSDFEDCSHDN